MISAYLLASTVSTPIYGKLADLFGRKRILLFGLALFSVGSMLSGTSQSMGQLIAMRTIQGLGAGAVGPIVLTLLGDLFTPRGAGADPGALQRGLGPLEHRGAADRRLADGQPGLALGLLRERPVRGRGHPHAGLVTSASEVEHTRGRTDRLGRGGAADARGSRRSCSWCWTAASLGLPVGLSSGG